MWCLGKKRGGCSAEGGKFGQPSVKYGAARPRQGKLRGTRDSPPRALLPQKTRVYHPRYSYLLPPLFSNGKRVPGI